MYLAVAPKGQRPALLPECSRGLALPFFPGVLGVCRTSSFQETLAGTLGLSPTGAQSLMQHRGKEVPQRSGSWTGFLRPSHTQFPTSIAAPGEAIYWSYPGKVAGTLLVYTILRILSPRILPTQ